jgi:hypothetical protein
LTRHSPIIAPIGAQRQAPLTERLLRTTLFVANAIFLNSKDQVASETPVGPLERKPT